MGRKPLLLSFYLSFLLILPLFAQDVTQKKTFDGVPSLGGAFEFEKSATEPRVIEIVLKIESIGGRLEMPEQPGQAVKLGVQSRFSARNIPLIDSDFAVINGRVTALTSQKLDSRGVISGRPSRSEKTWRIHPDFLNKYTGNGKFVIDFQIDALLPATEGQGTCNVTLPHASGFIQINYLY